MIRDFRPADIPALVELHRDAAPDIVPPTVAGFRHWLESHPPRAQFRMLVAEDGGRPVGFAEAYLNWATSTPGVGVIWIGVRSDVRGRGIGHALWERAEQHLREHGARKLETGALEDTPGERFAEARGFRRTRTELVSRLDVGAVDLARFAELEERRARDGFRAVPLREVAERRDELHAVYAAAMADVPADQPEDDIRREDFEEHVLGDPELQWDGSAVVLADGRPVSLAFILVNPELAMAANELTGTLADHRGRGLARLAKVATIRWAAANGIREIATENDAETAAMWGLNQSLGYRLCHRRSVLARSVADG